MSTEEQASKKPRHKGAHLGNNYARGNSGKPKNFKTPDDLWNAFVEYQEWAKAHPWYRYEPIKTGDEAGTCIPVPVGRPLTIDGFCIFCDITNDSFIDYGKNESHKEFFYIQGKIKKEIYNHKLEGAAVGNYNANIIARDLGLREKTDVELSGETKTKVVISIDDSACKI
jgi:hypothetical protein